MSNGKVKVCLIVGHSESSQGAANKSAGITEFQWNDKIATAVANRLVVDFESIEPIIVYRDVRYKELPEKVNKIGPDFIISFHCNAFNGTASGCETLYYYKSRKGRILAEIVQDKVLAALGNKDRGIKPRTTEDRGGYLLRYTDAPAVITEPFFIDNDQEYQNAVDHFDDLVSAYCNAIDEFSKIRFTPNI